MSKESIQRFVGWTGEDSALKLVKSWLKNCANNHTDCDRYQPTSLPDRVLDVSGDALKLYESSNEDYSYTALSHCWGKTKAKCTTYRANLETQKKEIAWDALPRTFQEAVKVTRALGIKYIWIDSIVSHVRSTTFHRHLKVRDLVHSPRRSRRLEATSG
jgi:hypothetical protein